MEWQKISNTIHLFRMLWLHEDGTWFAGRFVDDVDYGKCVVSDEEEFIRIEKVTHYMIIDTNTK